jgi:two-component system sensor histidine kinase DesK
MMGVRDSWWDGPWPWLAYLVFYPLPWLWRGPSTIQLAASLAALAVFLPTYILAYRLAGRRLVAASLLLLVLGIALAPVGGGWTVITVYAGAVAARLKPYRAAVALIGFVALATLATALLLGQPPLYWAAGVLLIVMTGGAGVSREMFFDRTEALLASQEEVRRLAGTAERERIGRDLHDVVGRALTLAALKADLAVRLVERDPAAAAAEMRDAGEAARAGLAEVRAALAGHAGGGLAHELAASERALAAAGVTLTVAGDPDALPAGAGAVLAMTLREAVTNVVRHADASWCAVEIEHLGGGARLTVTDDGTGGSVKEGSGLTGMRQRLVAAGGSLTLDDAPPGLRLVADVPT